MKSYFKLKTIKHTDSAATVVSHLQINTPQIGQTDILYVATNATHKRLALLQKLNLKF